MRDPDYAEQFIAEFSDRILYGCDICQPFNDHQYIFNDFLTKMRKDGRISEDNYYKLVRGNAIKLLGLEDKE
jgi:predicted TIM-barrel fold metal-dependent hydrolase